MVKRTGNTWHAIGDDGKEIGTGFGTEAEAKKALADAQKLARQPAVQQEPPAQAEETEIAVGKAKERIRKSMEPRG